jgi:hypothetical protein
VRRHELDVFSLIVGLMFVLIGAGYLLGALTDVRLDPGWVAPVVLVGLGAAGLAATVLGRSGSGD